jgi:ribosomal protein S18 acetylase RimI-like enzyme
MTQVIGSACPSDHPVQIRILEADDARAWSELRLEALERELDAFGSSVEDHLKLTDDIIRTRLAPDPQNKFVVGAFAAGQLIGIAGLVRDQGLKDRHKAWVWGVYLTSNWRRQGIGRSLMKSLLEQASEVAGLEQITLRVAATQAAAINLYKSLGFVSFGCEPRALKIGDHYVDEEYMVLMLRRKADPSSA